MAEISVLHDSDTDRLFQILKIFEKENLFFRESEYTQK